MILPSAILIGSTGLSTPDYLVMLLYMLGMLGIGWYLSRKQLSIEDFFVAGRKMPWLATGLSMLATLMSTLSYLGTPGEMIKHGIGQGISFLALPFAFLVVGYLWVPFFMRLRLTSAYEYLELRFGTKARMLGVILYLYMRFLWMGAIIFTASSAVAQITGDTAPDAIRTLTGGLLQFDQTQWFYTVMLTTGFVTTLYTMLGGIAAVIWTDVMQFLVLFGGAIVTLLVVMANTGTGPVTWWKEATSVAHEIPPVASWDLGLRTTICWTVLNGLMWHICTHASDQVALQRYFTNPSASAARKTALVNYVLDLTMQVLLALVGMALLTYYLAHPQELPTGESDPRAFADRSFPHFIAHGLPVGLSGLVVAAVFAVAQSSIDSGINSTATVITVDLVRRLRKQPMTAHGELRMAKRLTLGIGIFVTLTALGVAQFPGRYNIIDLQLKSFNAVLGPLGAIFMTGMLFRHVGQTAVVTAGITGTCTALFVAFMDVIPGVTAPSSFLIIPLSWLVTLLLAALLGAFLKEPEPSRIRGLTWQGVVRRNESRAADIAVDGLVRQD